MREKIAVYPGSFDPITNGHMNIIERALEFFDKLIVAVAYNPNKSALFSVGERMEMIQTALKNDLPALMDMKKKKLLLGDPDIDCLRQVCTYFPSHFISPGLY